MKYSILICSALLFWAGSCTSDDIISVTEPMIFPSPKQNCIIDTISDDSSSGFIIMTPLGQQFGRAVGTKINQEFEAGLNVLKSSDSTFSVTLNMIWPNRADSLEGEVFTISNIPISTSQKCFPIYGARQRRDSVNVSHLNYHVDVPYLRYEPDPLFENKLFVDTFSVETGFFHGYFSARMIGDTFFLPELPRIVEYINVEMTAP